MNILHVLSQHELTGAEVYAVNLISEQVHRKHAVYQVSNGFYKETEAIKFQLEVETKSTISFWKNVSQLRELIQQKNIQVIHTHSRAAAKLVYYATLFLKVGVVSTIHGRQHISLSKKILNQYGQFIIAVCQNIEKQLTQEFKYNRRFIKVIPNGIHQNDFKFKKKELIQSDQKTLKIAVIGRMTGPKKVRTELFIAQFPEILKKQNKTCQIDIIGNESTPITINSELLHKYDVICGSGRVCMESLLSGVPCIAFGESQYLGLVTSQNIEEFFKSNFGDIGENFNLPQFNHTLAKRDADILSNNILSEFELSCLSEKARTLFSNSNIYQKVMRLYESAYFIRHYSKWIPILMYHKVPNQEIQSRHKIYVTEKNFERHLQLFKARGLQTVTFEDLALFRKAQKPWSEFPKKPFMLTFDDGYEDNLSHADPLLKKYNFKAQIYLLADTNVNHNHWDTTSNSEDDYHPIISGDDRKKWSSSNFIIGSHGLKHDRLPSLNDDDKMHELTESKLKLENEFSRKIISYAYTYGDTNADCAQACQRAGYDYGLNTDSGGLTVEEDPYSVFRVNVFPDETWASLWKKTSTWYRRYYYHKRKK
jgi:peptidoglycan/xylan/chitin deacetylase (PgdA/CDA1 family)